MCITVIVPTFNRAHLLAQTIPTYIQEGVRKLILVDDCSKDGTREAAASLCLQYPRIIQYVRNEENMKQTYSKNRGKGLAGTEFVYFGDDDSTLVPGSLAALIETSRRYHADIVGAAALYCTDNMNPEEAYRRYLFQKPEGRSDQFVNLKRLRFSFTKRPSLPLQLPVTQAAALVTQDWYRRIDFDLRYRGNCFREETDFLLQAHSAGARIFFDGRAVQINLPPKVATGGARSSGRLRYEWQCVVNTWKFLHKHQDYYRKQLGVSPLTPLLWFLWDRFVAASRKISR